ncbi:MULTISPECIES: esterase/lipase family protein [unclassified Streptomyces]|uniref:esterase/lipase family protein n=1 Tax=Streptomyces sp. NPDC055082 TaxID=3365718 RepID=UPI0037CEBD75
MLRRPTAVLTVLIALALGFLSTPVSSAEPRSSHNPVIFVHGYNADPGVWGSLKADFRGDGYNDNELFSWGYDTHQSVNEVLAARFQDYLNGVLRQTGAQQVDLVSHSFGSLPSRWYVKFGGGTDTVAHWISLGGPNHGTYTAWACATWDQACRDMSPGSYVQKQLAAGDETPGTVKYATFWSHCDEVINPDNSVALGGATNINAGCLKHNELLGDEGVSRDVRAFLAG